MSAQDTIGKLIDESERRDAIHIAMAPVVASQMLLPGEDIGFIASNQVDVGRKCAKHIGIVDPFLEKPVITGERFWMLLYPNTISSLRHEWTHPDFMTIPPEVTPANGERKATSIAWIKDFADKIKQHYDSLMRAAETWVACADYTYDNSESYKDVDYEKWSEFWKHYSIVTGEDTSKMTASPFTCSC